MKYASFSRAAQIHKALAHPARLRILAMLRDGELCVCQITAVLGLATSTVSAHLRELRNAGLTSERKTGRWVNIGLVATDEVRELLDPILTRIDADPQAVADRRLVARLHQIPVETLCRSGFGTVRGRNAIETEKGTGT